jgi:DNA-directed RNA polymerase specialized sigma24 family protein
MNTHDIDILFAEHSHLINRAIQINRPLLTALRLEDEDVAQHLAITMLAAIRKFDSERSASLAAYISCSLQYEILNIKRRHRPHGITGVPKNRRIDFMYLDNEPDDDHKPHMFDDISALDVSEWLESLSDLETEIIEMRVQGHSIKRKEHITALDEARDKYTALYGERRVA